MNLNNLLDDDPQPPQPNLICTIGWLVLIALSIAAVLL